MYVFKAIQLLVVAVALVTAVGFATTPLFAAEEEAAAVEQETSMPAALRAVGLGFAAAIAMAVAAWATAKVQAAVGAGGTGVLAEKPEAFGSVLLLYAIPETLVLLGFVLAFLLIGKI